MIRRRTRTEQHTEAPEPEAPMSDSDVLTFLLDHTCEQTQLILALTDKVNTLQLTVDSSTTTE